LQTRERLISDIAGIIGKIGTHGKQVRGTVALVDDLEDPFLNQQQNGRQFYLLGVSPVQNEFPVITETVEGVPRKLHDNPSLAILELHSDGINNRRIACTFNVRGKWTVTVSECELYKRAF